MSTSIFDILTFILNHLTSSSVLSWMIDHPVSSALFIFISFLLYKLHCFNEIIVDLKDEVPKNVRILPDQSLPPFYPNGWIPILESKQVVTNQIKSIICFGQELIVVRGPSEQIYVLDAFCPHLGANLSVGSNVERNCSGDDCIRCPFHSWAFRMSDGDCVDVPSEDVVPKAKLKTWQAIELNQQIFVWYHADNVEPQWFPTQNEEVFQGKWTWKARTEHYVNCHLQEIPENGADVAHLNAIHSSSFLMGSTVDSNLKDHWFSRFLTHEWSAQWSPCSEPDVHKANLRAIAVTKILGWEAFQVELNVHQIGPCYVELKLDSNFLGGVQGIIFQTIKPIGPMRNSIIHNIYLDNSIFGYFFSKFLIKAEAKMLERDIKIWNRKAFLRKPYFGKNERSLVKFRRWFNQFYSESSKLANKDFNDW